MPEEQKLVTAEKPREISPEEAGKLFDGGEIKLDKNGKPLPEGANNARPEEGATLSKRHAWY